MAVSARFSVAAIKPHGRLGRKTKPCWFSSVLQPLARTAWSGYWHSSAACEVYSRPWSARKGPLNSAEVSKKWRRAPTSQGVRAHASIVDHARRMRLKHAVHIFHLQQVHCNKTLALHCASSGQARKQEQPRASRDQIAVLCNQLSNAAFNHAVSHLLLLATHALEQPRGKATAKTIRTTKADVEAVAITQALQNIKLKVAGGATTGLAHRLEVGRILWRLVCR